MYSLGNFRRLNPGYEMPNVKSDTPMPPPNVPDQYGNYPPSPPPIPFNPSTSGLCRICYSCD